MESVDAPRLVGYACLSQEDQPLHARVRCALGAFLYLLLLQLLLPYLGAE